MQTMVETADQLGVAIHRGIVGWVEPTTLSCVRSCMIFQLGAERRIELIIAPGPRRTWDLGPQSARLKELAPGVGTRA